MLQPQVSAGTHLAAAELVESVDFSAAAVAGLSSVSVELCSALVGWHSASGIAEAGLDTVEVVGWDTAVVGWGKLADEAVSVVWTCRCLAER